eukprot:gene595-1151_t
MVYNNPNDHYSPSDSVQSGHRISNSNLELTQGYVQSAATVPIILLVLGFLSLIFVNFGFLFRCCCKCCYCVREENDVPPDKTSFTWAQSRLTTRFRITIAVYVLAVLIILVDHLVLISNLTDVNNGVDNVKGAVSGMNKLFVRINSNSDKLKSYTDDLSFQLSSTTCQSNKTSISANIKLYSDASSSFKSIAKTLVQTTDVITDGIDLYAVTYRTYALFGLYGIPIIAAFVFIICQACKTIGGMKFAIFWGEFSFLIILILGTIWFLLTVILSDLCMAPTANILNLAPSGLATNITTYFTTCQGENHLSILLNSQAKKGISNMNNSITYALKYCPNDAALLQIKKDTIGISNVINDLDLAISCVSIQPLWFEFINEGTGAVIGYFQFISDSQKCSFVDIPTIKFLNSKYVINQRLNPFGSYNQTMNRHAFFVPTCFLIKVKNNRPLKRHTL